jgi:hypothetical protein
MGDVALGTALTSIASSVLVWDMALATDLSDDNLDD